LSAVLGLLLGLVTAELAFSSRDDGAFPHLNVYVADEALGVALEPDTSTRLSVSTNPVTDIHIGPEGFRGAALGPPADDEVLVVGDSQVFGLGVNDDETFSAVLATLLDRPVINGGVPTYGPLEYTEVVRRTFETRHPTTVVWVVNMANDFFEHSRPNSERHAEWDHWAVRRETAPSAITSFPGRTWLYQRSHLFFAIRQYLHAEEEGVEVVRELGLPSEGSLHDLVHDGDAAAARHAEAETAHHEAMAEHSALLERLATERGSALARVDDALVEAMGERLEGTSIGHEEYGEALYGPQILDAAREHPGDILYYDDGAENGRSVTVTASLLNQAQRLRRRWIASVATRDGALRDAVAEEDAVEARLAAERARGIDERHVPSVLEPRLAEIAALCAEHGAELVIVALPLDVVVSDTEFAKYGAEPVDMAPARTLLNDLVETAERMGVRALDPTEALAAAEPGAFLDGDLHMSPTGHAALAAAIRDRLAGPIPLTHPGAGLPEGRTAVPLPHAFVHEPEASVRGSSAAHCVTHRIGEWLRISCRDTPRIHPTGVDVISGGRGETMQVSTAEASTLLAPLMAGEDLVADFHWTDRTQRFTAHWPEGAPEPEMSFGEALPAARPTLAVSDGDARLCACHLEVVRFEDCPEEDGYPVCAPSCMEVYGTASDACMTSFGDDCGALLACARGDLDHRPSCPEGRVSTLASGVCLPLCRTASPAVACAEGRCTPWQGAEVCVP
jgi:hypothetical protein